MTREQVMALSDEELCIRAAELAAFVRQEFDVETPTGTVPAWTRRIGADTECAIGVDAFSDYLHDIAAAWELVDEADRRGYKLSLHTGQNVNDSLVTAIFWGLGDRFAEAVGNNATRAITRAFILAMSGGADAP
jgi:hypothetical protein